MARRLKLLGMKTYNDYLSSDLWRRNKQSFYTQWGRRPQCFICRKRSDLHLHHCTYERLGCEDAADLVILCKACHFEVHRQVKAGACRLKSAHVYVKSLRSAGHNTSSARPTRIVRAKKRRRKWRL
jgi:hypothetical protein